VPKMNEVLKDCRRSHKDDYDLYSAWNLIRVITSRRMKLAGHVQCNGEVHMGFQWGNLREGEHLENRDLARCTSWSETRISWCTWCFNAYHHQTYLQTHITTVLPYVTGIKNQTLQGRDYRMSGILKSGIIFSINKLLHILRFLTLQFPMKTVLHTKFRLRSQTGYMWWTMQLLFVLCEYWPQDKLNMEWKILSLHLEELKILINSVLAEVTHPCARLRHKMEYLS
jgi:hypothetical protein